MIPLLALCDSLKRIAYRVRSGGWRRLRIHCVFFQSRKPGVVFPRIPNTSFSCPPGVPRMRASALRLRQRCARKFSVVRSPVRTREHVPVICTISAPRSNKRPSCARRDPDLTDSSARKIFSAIWQSRANERLLARSEPARRSRRYRRRGGRVSRADHLPQRAPAQGRPMWRIPIQKTQKKE